ncbi:MAG TPA: hypothetical protein DCG22_01900 [Bacteroidetes bacterium]|nr:hypothetical protein [Bacteroidota bacterium]
MKSCVAHIRNLLSQFPFIHLDKLVNSSMIDPLPTSQASSFRGNDPSSGKSLLNNLHTST